MTAGDIANYLTVGESLSGPVLRGIKSGDQVVAVFKKSKSKIPIELDRALFDSTKISELEKFLLENADFPNQCPYKPSITPLISKQLVKSS